MFEPRLYRAMLLLGLAAAVVLMFSVVSRPQELRTTTAADAFDGERAVALTRELLRLAPRRAPGSSGDRAAGDFVERRFRAVAGGQVLEQRFGASFDGRGVELRNVTLVLPGTSGGRIVIAAPRDCAEGRCATSSGAATAALLELADAYDGARHRKTLVLTSLDGSAAGAAGARELGRALERDPAEAVLVISQPGAARLEQPFVVPWSSGPQSTSIQLIESAKEAVDNELAAGAALRLGTVQSLMRLAIPAGLGDQAPLIEEGAAAVAISSAGELPLAASEDRLAQLSPETLGAMGRATFALAVAIDERADGLEHGPEAYVPLAGKLIPGWALALLALALLVPVAVVSVDALARASRHGEPALAALAWVLSRMIPFAAAFVLAYALASVGLIPDPAFPFDPERFPLDFEALLWLLLLAVSFVAALWALRLLALPEQAHEALAPAVGVMLFVAALGIWLANPYLALLLVPTVHLWLLASLFRGRLAPALAAALAGLVVPLVALGFLADQLGAGLGVPWQLLLMFTGRHFGPLAVVPLCLLGGCLVALLTIAASGPAPSRSAGAAAHRRVTLSHAGPGSLGGTESALPRR